MTSSTVAAPADWGSCDRKGLLQQLRCNLLDRLAAGQPRMAAVVEMRYFGGMKDADIALRLGVTDRTVRTDWHAARAWLFGQLCEP